MASSFKRDILPPPRRCHHQTIGRRGLCLVAVIVSLQIGSGAPATRRHNNIRNRRFLADPETVLAAPPGRPWSSTGDPRERPECVAALRDVAPAEQWRNWTQGRCWLSMEHIKAGTPSCQRFDRRVSPAVSVCGHTIMVRMIRSVLEHATVADTDMHCTRRAG